jgi:acyl dehydratase
MMFFEDLAVGMRFDLGRHQLAPGEIDAFARSYDPLGLTAGVRAPATAKPPDEARRTIAAEPAAGPAVRRPAAANRPAAPGWLIACLWMRNWVAFIAHVNAEARAAGRPVAELGPSPGIERLEWPAPAMAGDTLVFATEVRALRVSQSRPRWGMMTLANGARLMAQDDRGPCVLSFTSSAFVERRDAALDAASSGPRHRS